MNKIMLIISILVAVFFVHLGLSMNTQFESLSKQTGDTVIQNHHMGMEIQARQSLTKRYPKAMSKAFSLLLNDLRYLEENSGTVMDLYIDKSKDNDDIASHYIDSQYRGIKKLPVLIEVNKFSSETDMSAVLNDIYQLEEGTDFKATEINKAGDILIVKGDVYGL